MPATTWTTSVRETFVSKGTRKSPGVDPADDFTIDEIMPKERGVHSPPPPILHRLLWDDQMDEQTPLLWLIDGILPVDSVAVLYGDPGVGKSFIALDWAFSIATEERWQGHKVLGGDVVYVAAEGWQGMKDRVAAWKAHRNITSFDRTGVAFYGRPIRLLDQRDIVAFADSIEAQTDDSPALIVIDTLARNAVGIEENSATHMGQVVGSCDYLRERFGCTVLLVHHSTKSKEFGPSLRGSGALKAAMNTVALVTETKEGPLRLYCEKQKDGPKFATKYFKMVPVGKSVVLSLTENPKVTKKKKEQQDDPYPEAQQSLGV